MIFITKDNSSAQNLAASASLEPFYRFLWKDPAQILLTTVQNITCICQVMPRNLSWRGTDVNFWQVVPENQLSMVDTP